MSNKFTTEQIINSLDGIQKAEPAPFLYSRIKGKMAKEDTGMVMKLFRMLTSPAFSLSIACFFVVINGYFLMNNLNEDPVIDENNQTVAAEYIQIPENPYVSPTENP